MINEGGRFTKPSDKLEQDKAKAAWAKYDNDLFQTARLSVYLRRKIGFAFLTTDRITCGLYINITLLDYLRTIVNLNRSNTTWTLVGHLAFTQPFANDCRTLVWTEEGCSDTTGRPRALAIRSRPNSTSRIDGIHVSAIVMISGRKTSTESSSASRHPRFRCRRCWRG